MKFFRKDSKNKNLILLDIGSQFVKALLLEIDKEEKRGTLLNWAKEKSFSDFEKLFSSCQKAIVKLKKRTIIGTDEIFLGVGGDFLKGISTTFCYKREESSQKIDLAELKNLVQKTQWRAYDRLRKEFSLETGLPETDVRLVNANIVDIRIDKSHIPNPVGFEGENICLTIFNNYTSSRILDNLQELVARLDLNLMGINFQPYALFQSLEVGGLKDDVIIIDIGGKITDVVLVKNKGEIVDIKSFNLGGHLFTKTLSEFLGLDFDSAELIKTKYSKGEVSISAKEKLDELFHPNILSWFNGIKIILTEFSKNYKSVPSNVLLCGGGSFLPGIEEVLKKRANFKTKLISPREIARIRNKTKFQEITPLALASLAVDSYEPNEFSPILKRAIRLIQT